MSENQTEIDALLAEVSALAEEAVQGGGEADGDFGVSPEMVSPAGSPAASARASAGAQSPAGTAQSHPAPTSSVRRDHTERVLNLEVPVIVQLASRTMPLSEILGLSSGAIIEFEKPFDSELDLMINNKCIGNGQAVKVGENFGLRVTQLGSLRERLEALTGQ